MEININFPEDFVNACKTLKEKGEMTPEFQLPDGYNYPKILLLSSELVGQVNDFWNISFEVDWEKRVIVGKRNEKI